MGEMFLSYAEEDFMPQRTVPNETMHLCVSPLEVLGRVRVPSLGGSGPGKLLAGNCWAAHCWFTHDPIHNWQAKGALDTGLFPS